MTDFSDNPAEILANVHTPDFPALLQKLRCSLLFTTTLPRTMLVAVRGDRDGLHVDFVALKWIMGMAADSRRILVGGRDRVYEFRNMPTLMGGEETLPGRDAVYLLRNMHITGPVDMHDMAFAGDECWCVNTRFSCLCTLDQTHSFVPRWRPPFITSYAPADRCHLNGLAVQNNRPRFVTALGETNELEAWREKRLVGGIVVDVESGETVVRGLSMPHSPRLHRDRLWILESAKGGLVTADLKTGKLETVIRLPGFARGLDFVGPYAFVGVSKLRATNAQLDIVLTDENPDRSSGIWIVNIETGRSVGFLRFAGPVDEIFAVQLLRDITYPHINGNEDAYAETAWVLPAAAIPEVELVSGPRSVGQ